MSHFECNRFISDVPMRFNDRYLSRIIDESSLMKYDEIEDMSRFYVSDYKFDAELFAIETYEMHNKSMNEKKKIAYSQTLEKNENLPSGNTLLRQMVTGGGILTPELVHKPEVNNSHSQQNCDSNSNDNTNKPVIRQINLKDFDYNDSSPFDTLELKTIDEREELTQLFRTMNADSNSASNNTTPVTNNSAIYGYVPQTYYHPTNPFYSAVNQTQVPNNSQQAYETTTTVLPPSSSTSTHPYMNGNIFQK